MSSTRANGITIEYDSFGLEGSETILLISGLGTQMISWAVPFCDLLAGQGFRVIRFDNRDTGLSTHFTDSPIPDFAAVAGAVARGQRPAVPYTLYDMVEDLIGLLDALSIDRAHVVGRSMGGMIAQLVASEHPDRTISLTSIMSSTGSPGLPSTASEVMAMLTGPAPHPSKDEAGFLAHSIAFARMISSPGYPFDETYQRNRILAELGRSYNPAGFVRQIAAIVATGDLRARLATVTAPTLVMHGADDPLIPLACGKDTAANIKGADLMIIEGMGHDLPHALHDTIAAAIIRNARRLQ